jgi:hypothetical protein
MKSIAAAAAVVLAVLANSASAFVSQSASVPRTATSALAVSFEDELGAQKPLGYW